MRDREKEREREEVLRTKLNPAFITILTTAVSFQISPPPPRLALIRTGGAYCGQQLCSVSVRLRFRHCVSLSWSL